MPVGVCVCVYSDGMVYIKEKTRKEDKKRRAERKEKKRERTRETEGRMGACIEERA